MAAAAASSAALPGRTGLETPSLSESQTHAGMKPLVALPMTVAAYVAPPCGGGGVAPGSLALALRDSECVVEQPRVLHALELGSIGSGQPTWTRN